MLSSYFTLAEQVLLNYLLILSQSEQQERSQRKETNIFFLENQETNNGRNSIALVLHVWYLAREDTIHGGEREDDGDKTGSIRGWR